MNVEAVSRLLSCWMQALHAKLQSTERFDEMQAACSKLRKEQDVAAQLAELAALRERMSGLEQQVNNGKAASNLISQMIAAGHVVQDSEDSVVINSANGQ